MNREEVIDNYFMEHRAKLLDIAAFLDRVDRAPSHEIEEDFRLIAFRKALEHLTQDSAHRARRVLEIFSDRTAEIPQSALGKKGALGASRNED